MKVDLEAVLKDLEGNDLEEQKDGQPVKVSLKKVCKEALMFPHKNDSPSGEEKFKRWELATRVNAGGSQDFTPEEVTLIKKLIGLGYTPTVVGPAYQLLNK